MPPTTPDSDRHIRALISELRKSTAATMALVNAINGLVGVALSDSNAPADSEESVPKKPPYMCAEDAEVADGQ